MRTSGCHHLSIEGEDVMTSAIEKRLAEEGLELPPTAAAAGNYVPYTVSGNLVFVSGQLPMENGKLAATGRVGEAVTLEAAQHAAKLCALNILAQVKAACDGDLDRVARCLKLGGFVNSGADFTQQPQVVNGASDLLVKAMGEAGRHARFAVSAPALPMDSAVEIDAIFELKD